jgi:hypothetical protein
VLSDKNKMIIFNEVHLTQCQQQNKLFINVKQVEIKIYDSKTVNTQSGGGG